MNAGLLPSDHSFVPCSIFLVRYSLGSAHIPEMNRMRNNSVTHFPELNIFYAIFLACLLDYFADGRVVDMRDLREQVMFDLEVQTTNKPGDQLILSCKICCGLDLVYGPLVLDGVDIRIWNRE